LFLLLWILGGLIGIALLSAMVRAFSRSARTRAEVQEEIRRLLHGGVIDRPPGRGSQVRGRLGQLEITVEVHRDRARPRQSPMWRVLAVGPVPIDRPVEARVAGWQGWIDPWLQIGETLMVPSRVGPEFSLHAERMPSLEHPLVAALRRQGAGLGAGALHARPDLMRAEARFSARPEENRPLFAFLDAMGEISELPYTRSGRKTAEAPRLRIKREAS